MVEEFINVEATLIYGDEILVDSELEAWVRHEIEESGIGG